MNDKRWFIASVLMLAAPWVSADELILKEGKTLTGRITKEDAEEFTIRLGKGMVLRVPKENVVKVTRTEPVPTVVPSTSTVPSYQIRTVKVSTTSVQPNGTAPKEDPVKVKSRSLHGFQITEIVRPEGPIKTKSLYSSWVPGWSATKSKDESGFKWVSGVVVATITVPVPSPAEEMRQKILSEGLSSFVETLHQLRSNSEVDLTNDSNQLFEEMKSQAEKRWQGYLRRMNSHPAPKK